MNDSAMWVGGRRNNYENHLMPNAKQQMPMANANCRMRCKNMYVRLELSTVLSVANFMRYDTIAAHKVWLLLVVQQGNVQSYADLFQFKPHTRTLLE